MQDKLYIDGAWVYPARGGTLDVIDPATEQVIHKAPAGTADDIDRAVKAARRAFDHGPWPKMPGSERAKILRAIANIITGKREFLARLEVADNGKPLPEALWDIDDVAGCFNFYAGLAEDLEANPEETIPLGEPRFSSSVVREPLGVVGAITPWNYPLLMVSWKVAPALAAGCTIVLKPSELTPLTALELGVDRARSRPSVRRAQHRHRHRPGRRPAADRASAGRQACLYRLGADRPQGDDRRRRRTSRMSASNSVANRPSSSLPIAISKRPSNGSCSASSGTRARSALPPRAC